MLLSIQSYEPFFGKFNSCFDSLFDGEFEIETSWKPFWNAQKKLTPAERQERQLKRELKNLEKKDKSINQSLTAHAKTIEELKKAQEDIGEERARLTLKLERKAKKIQNRKEKKIRDAEERKKREEQSAAGSEEAPQEKEVEKVIVSDEE